MQRCLNCQSQQIDGTIFCTDCGASLLAPSRPPPTLPIDSRRSPAPHSAPDSLAAAPAETRLGLTVLATGRQLRLQVHEELLIGRKDEARGILPDIDLGVDNGYDAGVSRRHAILSWREGVYYVEDLGSANGTFVNDLRVEPQTRAVLHHGDELRCGMLALRVDISP